MQDRWSARSSSTRTGARNQNQSASNADANSRSLNQNFWSWGNENSIDRFQFCGLCNTNGSGVSWSVQRPVCVANDPFYTAYNAIYFNESHDASRLPAQIANYGIGNISLSGGCSNAPVINPPDPTPAPLPPLRDNEQPPMNANPNNIGFFPPPLFWPAFIHHLIAFPPNPLPHEFDLPSIDLNQPPMTPLAVSSHQLTSAVNSQGYQHVVGSDHVGTTSNQPLPMLWAGSSSQPINPSGLYSLGTTIQIRATVVAASDHIGTTSTQPLPMPWAGSSSEPITLSGLYPLGTAMRSRGTLVAGSDHVGATSNQPLPMPGANSSTDYASESETELDAPENIPLGIQTNSTIQNPGATGGARIESESEGLNASALESMLGGAPVQAENVIIIDDSEDSEQSGESERDEEPEDVHSAMRLDVDNMNYEQLLELEEEIGNVRRKGLSEMAAKKYVIARKFKPGKDAIDPCCICQEEFKRGDETGTTARCSRHVFHAQCLRKWLQVKNECPICRIPAIYV